MGKNKDKSNNYNKTAIDQLFTKHSPEFLQDKKINSNNMKNCIFKETENEDEFQEGKRPMLSIGMTVYNQERYVAMAIESILMQRVNFDYEIVIAEDCSTDSSREIVIKYAKKYPRLIKLILQEHNVGLKEQSICLKKTCRGIYRTQLEGDDFLLSPDKLQMQVDFLESHPEYVAVSGRIKCANPSDKICAFPYGSLTSIYCFSGEYTLEHFQKWLLPSHTSALLYRNIFYKCETDFLDKYESYDVMGDRKTALLLLSIGKILVMPINVSVRRIDLQSPANFTGNSVQIQPYATICAWMNRLEEMAMDMFGISVNFQLEKRKQWVYSLTNFARSPSKNSLNSVKNVYRLSSEKNEYRAIFRSKLKAKIKAKIKKEGYLHGFINIARSAIKTFGKFIKSKEISMEALRKSENIISSSAVRK